MKNIRSLFALSATMFALLGTAANAPAEIVHEGPRVELWTDGGRFWAKQDRPVTIILRGSSKWQQINGCPIDCSAMYGSTVVKKISGLKLKGFLEFTFNVPKDAKPGTQMQIEFRIAEPGMERAQRLYRTLTVQAP